MKLSTAGQMRKTDRRAMETGIPGLALMEAAGVFAANVAETITAGQGRIVVACGSGNNGGDGWVVARHLAARGHEVLVLSVVPPDKLGGDAACQFLAARGAGVNWQAWQQQAIPEADLLVDALLGTGVDGAPRPPLDKLIQAINGHSAPVLALDIPSGLPSDGQPPGWPVVKAKATATFGLAKVGLFAAAGLANAGRVHVDPIGIAPQLMGETGIMLNTEENAARGLPARRRNSHKGSYGHGLLLAGSRGMSGAALLAGEAALRSGLGLLSVAAPQDTAAIVTGHLAEALTIPLAQTESGAACCEGGELAGKIGGCSAAAAGPGLGQDRAVLPCIQELVDSDLPLVLDADGLNLLAPGIPVREAPLVITPHPGEMSRLLGVDVERVVADPLNVVARAAEKWNCVVVLKGAVSWIAQPGGPVVVSAVGSEGLATGGSGDVLTGLLLGLLSQKVPAFSAAAAACWLMGRSSELAKHTLGTASQLPRDVIGFLPAAWLELAEQV